MATGITGAVGLNIFKDMDEADEKEEAFINKVEKVLPYKSYLEDD